MVEFTNALVALVAFTKDEAYSRIHATSALNLNMVVVVCRCLLNVLVEELQNSPLCHAKKVGHHLAHITQAMRF